MDEKDLEVTERRLVRRLAQVRRLAGVRSKKPPVPTEVGTVGGSGPVGPRIISRRCGGYLVVSPIGDSLQIGVTGATEEEGVLKFNAAVARWRELLSASSGSGR